MIDLNLSGYRALVCGSTQGIGRAIAIELSEMGASITLLARNEESLKSVLSDLKGNVKSHQYLVADFSDPSALEETLDTHLKNHSYEILINNTGGPPGGQAISAGLEEYRKAFNIHLICNQILASKLSVGMKDKKYGRIVNIISTSVKQPIPGLGVSNTIRGAVANWSKTISRELAPFGITVNNVLPGATKTQRLESIIEKKAGKLGVSEKAAEEKMMSEIPAARFAEAHEVAQAVAFLCSKSASYINGINLPVDGGRTSSL